MQRIVLKKIQPFTLLEVLISLTLTTILLSVLLAAYFQAETASLEGERFRNNLWPKRTMMQRLNALFTSLETPNAKDKLFFFSAQDGSALIFSYDNGMSLTPTFSGDVISELYLSKEKELSLLTWPSRESWTDEAPPDPKREVFLSGVDSLQFEFFQVAGEKENPQWVDSWDKAKNALPGMIRMRIKRSKSDKEELLIFLIPQTIGVIKA